MLEKILQEYRVMYIGLGNMPTTADQAVEKLTLILNRLGATFDGEKLIGVKPKTLSKWYADMVANGLKMSTRNNYVNILNPFLSWAVDMEYLDTDPGKKPIHQVLKVGKLPREDEIPEEERKQKALTEEQVRLLFEKMPGRYKVRDRAILALFLASGIRVSELCSLNISSIVNQPRGRIYLRRKGGAWKYTEVAEFCYKYIDEYLATRDVSDCNAPLFLSAYGNRYTREQVWNLLARKETALGLPTGVHILRHTTLSNVEKKGGASITRDLANHSSFATTNRYVHTTPEERSAAINSLDWRDL